MSFTDLTSRRFGRIVVVAGPEVRESDKGYTYRYWDCLCDCGTRVSRSGASLLRGNSNSCGCLHVETARKVFLKHGKKSWPEYNVWNHMLQRCTNPRNRGYRNYGGRGIAVCDRWLNSFENFIADMGRRPSQELMLERKNNDGPYCPENCVWATRKEQNRNTRQNRLLTHAGMTLIITEWAEITGISYGTLATRLKSGWSVDDALTRPLRRFA